MRACWSQVRAVVVDASGVTSVDLSSLAVIDDLVHEVGRCGGHCPSTGSLLPNHHIPMS